LLQIAFRLLLKHPFLGIGLDNFRLIYGQELGQSAWNDTIHTNNWYIETIVSAGLIGGIPFLVWLGLMVVDFWHTLRQPTVSIWQTAVAAGLIAFFIHGLLDYFLLFNPTALLFWLLVGLWFSLKNMGTSP
jgi:O-antigen ligase